MTDDREITEDESGLWDYVTREDKRWKEVKVGKPSEPVEEVELQPEPEFELPKKEIKTESKLPYLSEGEFAGVDRRTAEKLRKGKLATEATLDLHGMLQKEAFPSLTNFILDSVAKNRRCVLVITGKGLKPDGSVGVLRANVPQWLNNEELRPFILAFTYAQPKDGGEGVLYILLKKGR